MIEIKVAGLGKSYILCQTYCDEMPESGIEEQFPK
jgi:hypothetical protein